MKQRHLLAILLLLPLGLLAQNPKQRFVESSIPLRLLNGDDTSSIGGMGGWQAPFISAVDIDLDGIDDWIVKDAFSDREQVLLRNTDGSFRRSSLEHELLLPQISAFFEFIDYNGDGKKDLFAGETEIVIYTNESSQEDGFRLVRRLDTLRYTVNGQSEIIDYQIGEEPAIVDVDFDGDLDVLVFNNSGTRMQLYENMAQSNDGFEYVLNTEIWGFFEEAGLNSDILLGARPKKSGGHPGSKLLVFDHDGDNDLDLLLSDITSSKVTFLENGKSDFDLPYDSMISLTNDYPNSADKIEIAFFPSFDLLDVDLDGDDDLICARKTRSPIDNESVWYYENIGTNQNPDFTLSSKRFWEGDIIDLGIESHPAVLDLEGDGRQDLVVTGISHKNDDPLKKQISGMELFENINSSELLFENSNPDFLDFKSREFSYLRPCFGDINGDGSADFLYGTDRGRVFYILNGAEDGEAARFVNEPTQIASVDVNQSAAPYLYDVNADGNQDLIVGNAAGELFLYLGTGNTEFTLEKEKWGGVETSTFFYQYDYDENGEKIDSNKISLGVGAAKPALADIDLNGLPDLMVGSAWGKMYFYPNIDWTASRFKREENWLHNAIRDKQTAKDLGEYTSPYFGDLNGNGLPELIVGNSKGGIEVFALDSVPVSIKPVATEENAIFRLYPNPANGPIQLMNEEHVAINLSIYTLSGKLVSRHRLEAKSEQALILEPGFYLFQGISENGEHQVQKARVH